MCGGPPQADEVVSAIRRGAEYKVVALEGVESGLKEPAGDFRAVDAGDNDPFRTLRECGLERVGHALAQVASRLFTVSGVFPEPLLHPIVVPSNESKFHWKVVDGLGRPHRVFGHFSLEVGRTLRPKRGNQPGLRLPGFGISREDDETLLARGRYSAGEVIFDGRQKYCRQDFVARAEDAADRA